MKVDVANSDPSKIQLKYPQNSITLCENTVVQTFKTFGDSLRGFINYRWELERSTNTSDTTLINNIIDLANQDLN